MAISDELRKLVDPNNECCCEHCLGNKCSKTEVEAIIKCAEWVLENAKDNQRR